MVEIEESAAQRSARIRREKREAKIKGDAQERLNKITKLSGRTPESLSDDFAIPTPPRASSPPLPPSVTPTGTADPEQLKQQEAFLKAVLRSQTGQQQQQVNQQPKQDQGPEDPMTKMLGSMFGGMAGNSDSEGAMPSFDSDTIAKATGLPSFVTNMVFGKQETPASPAELEETRLWRRYHLLFASLLGIYMLFTVSRLTSIFGVDPPAPASIQNPFIIFVMGELVLHGSRAVLSTYPAKSSYSFVFKSAKDTARDGSILLFLLGIHHWWNGLL